MRALREPALQPVRIERLGPEVVLVSLAGEHDVTTAPELGAQLTKAVTFAEHVIVDLSDTEFVDSSTVAALLRAERDASAGNTRFTIVVGGETNVERTLELLGVPVLVETVGSLADAFGRLG